MRDNLTTLVLGLCLGGCLTTHAQKPSTVELDRLTLERRAIEAVIDQYSRN